MKSNSSAASRVGGQYGRLSRSPGVQRVVERARRAAAANDRLPRRDERVRLTAADVAGVRTVGVLTDAVQARSTRRSARSLGLPRTRDDAAAWAALGALAALVRVADDGRRRAVVVDTGAPRSLFARWASRAGFVPVALDVTRPDVVGSQIDAGGADLVVAVHPRRLEPSEADVELVHAAQALRRGGLVVLTLTLGATDHGGTDMAGVRSLIARADEQGLALVGDLDIDDTAQASAALREHRDEAGLVLLTFRRR